MTGLRIEGPSRLHFGLIGWGPDAPRQFGGIGLMIDRPGLAISARPSPEWSSRGPLADRALSVADRVARALAIRGIDARPLAFEIERAPEAHVGLGSGTQVALAIARLIAEASGLGPVPAPTLAGWTGRGARSGIGLHGFDLGGLIVDGGRPRGVPGAIPPLLSRLEFPADWSILVVVPPIPPGLHGPDEVAAFGRLPPVPSGVSDRICGLTLLGLLPAVVDRDLAAFGASLAEIQRLVGAQFAPAQGGGLFAGPQSDRIVNWMTSRGLLGVGQSSWGPALYGFSAAGEDDRAGWLAELVEEFALGPGAAFWTSASPGGAIVERSD